MTTPSKAAIEAANKELELERAWLSSLGETPLELPPTEEKGSFVQQAIDNATVELRGTIVLLRKGFATCNSQPGGQYFIKIAYPTLEKAQEAYKALVTTDLSQQREEVRQTEITTLDLDKEDWEAIQKAASESNWIPPEYMRGDWVHDVCNWLRNGTHLENHSTKTVHSDPCEHRHLRSQGLGREQYCEDCGETV